MPFWRVPLDTCKSLHTALLDLLAFCEQPKNNAKYEELMDRPFPAYKGDEPYVFVSYAHEDASLVYPELQWLKDQGFNIWYDEGISPGGEWRTELADSIEGCSLFLYFVTPRSAVSIHCNREVNFAIDHDKQLLTVHLEETALPSGLELTLSSIQAVLGYKLSDQEYRLKLLKGTSDHIHRGVAQAATGIPTRLRYKSKTYTVLGVVTGLLVGSLVTVLVTSIASSFFSDKVNVPLLKEDLAKAQSTISSLRTKLASANENYMELQNEHNVVLGDINAPVQINPPTGSHLLGESVALEWTYSDDSLKDDFAIQISPVSIGEPKNRRGINKKEMKFYFEISDDEHGEFLWRLKKGDSASENQWSRWGQFTTYRSAIERIRSRKELIVGTVPAYRGPFIYRQDKSIVGFDIEFVKWIGNQLGNQLGIPELKISIVESNWDDLLVSVEDRRFDLALASLSKSKERKAKYKKLRFSDGYIDVKPILISLQEKDLPRELNNSTVGVTYDTTNELAAESLVAKYGITVNAESEFYIGLRDKLSSGEITFALVDDILIGFEWDSGFYQYDLSNILKDSGYFENNFDEKKEQYAIAIVYEPRVDDDLLGRINGILQSPGGKNKLKEMKVRLESREEWQSP